MSDFIERSKFTCALGGAITTITAINRAVPIVHASGGCAGMLAGTYNMAGGYKGSGYCGGNMIPTSNVSEKNIVFGGDSRLEEQIENTINIINADLYFVVSGCQVEIIGDNVIGVANQFSDRGDVLAANTPGFIGNTFKGYEVVLSTIAEKLINKVETKDAKTVNILGVVPGHDVFFRGNLTEIKRLLALIGIKANTFFGNGETVEMIRNYGDAALTIVLSDNYGVDTAKVFEEVHGIPYITTDLPIGPTDSENFLRRVGELLKVEKALTEAVIAAEKVIYYSFIERILDIYSDLDLQRYAIISADSNYAFPLTRFIADDFGWIPHLVVINDLFEDEEQKKYLDKFEQIESETKPKVIFEAHTGQLKKHIQDSWRRNSNDKYYDGLNPTYIIGSSLEVTLAQKLGAAFLSVAFPVTNRVVLAKGYAGFNGATSLVEDLLSVLVAGR